ncbi:hypothetical protein EDB85DRAFT_2280667 [Lactarius pseudohatsudake]|nr:hypothetical protein EDB85DRAFT_2280667 [Lactarius pseudohatsudake]
MVAVVVAPSLHGRRRSLRAADSRVIAPWSCHRRAVVAPSSYRCRAIVVPLSRRCHTIFAPSVVVVRVVVVRLAPRRVRRRVGLASEWWWWLAVRVHVWEWRRWWASVGPVAVTAESAAWERPKSPSPPPPPPCSTQARGRHLQPIPTYKSAAPRDDVATLGRALTRPASDDGAGTTASARQRDPDSVGHDGATTTVRPRRPTTPTQPRCNSTRKRRRRHHNSVGHGATTTPYSTQEPPQRYPHTARNPHRYDTNDDGDATAGTARSWAGRAGSTMQQELSSSGGPRGCRRQWLHGQWWQQQGDYRSDGGSM